MSDTSDSTLTQLDTTDGESVESSSDGVTSFDEKLVETLSFRELDGFSHLDVEDVFIEISFPDGKRLFDGFSSLASIPKRDVDTDVVDIDDEAESFILPHFEPLFNAHFENPMNSTFGVPVFNSDGKCIHKFQVDMINDVRVIYKCHNKDTDSDVTLAATINDLREYTGDGKFLSEGDMDNVPRAGDSLTLRTNEGVDTGKLYKGSRNTLFSGWFVSALPFMLTVLTYPINEFTFIGSVLVGTALTLLMTAAVFSFQKMESFKVTSVSIDGIDYYETDVIDKMETFHIESIDGTEYLVNSDSDSDSRGTRKKIENSNGTVRDDVMEFLTAIGMEKLDDNEYQVRMTNDPDVYNDVDSKLYLTSGVFLLPPDA